ncbi:hypothetical protein L0Y65_06665 [Candidatus Micrarchaeota archaeon]|nr:hypothetical protein [Candidatus Micrarchaeota archaeon]
MGNETRLVALAFVALLLSGCTINPQDAAPAGQSAGNISGASGSTENPPTFTMEEVATHNAKGDCWMVISGKVLDLSGYTTHPGGDTFVPYCGKDGTEGFATMGGKGKDHSPGAYMQIETYVIGRVG